MKLTSRQQIFRYFDRLNGGFVTAKRIAKVTGYSYQVVMSCLRQMIDEGTVYRVRCWSSDGDIAYTRCE